MLWKFVATLGLLGIGASSAASAQTNGAVLFSKPLFKGAEISVYGPTRSIDAFVVKSLRIPPNSIWELCTGNTFTHCTRFSQSRNGMVMTVRSARPVAPPIAASAIAAVGPVRGSDVSLRGLASEFFVLPQENGNRIEVGSRETGSASERAASFCRAHGWHVSAYEREQSIGGREYLADVLCADELH